MNNKALLVGLNAYPNPNNNLRGCINDIIDMEYFITTKNKVYAKENIKTLTDNRATKNNILDHLNWLLLGASAGDQILFHYSGHGNYFNLNIIDHLINGTEVQFAVTAERILNKESNELEKKQAFSVIRNHKNDEKLNTVLDKEKTDFYNYEEKALKKPAILFPARFFLEDVFGDCSISEKAFNIMILTKTEKDLFVQIRNRNVKEVELLSESDKIGKKPYSILDEKGKLNTESIKTIKVLMGTKAYKKGIATLNNGTKLEFSHKAYAEENREI
jgi:hypothetical protein